MQAEVARFGIWVVSEMNTPLSCRSKVVICAGLAGDRARRVWWKSSNRRACPFTRPRVRMYRFFNQLYSTAS